MGSDVRLLLAARDIGHDLERIADEASVIAKRAMVISERGPLKNLLHVPSEGIIACEVLRLALDSFIEGDLAKARLVLERDAEIDALNRRNYEELFGKAGDAAKVSASHVELIFISKALERIGDHSKNIAEQVIFLLSGADHENRRAVRVTLDGGPVSARVLRSCPPALVVSSCSCASSRCRSASCWPPG
jgi:phosphate transport system protein